MVQEHIVWAEIRIEEELVESHTHTQANFQKDRTISIVILSGELSWLRGTLQ